MSSQPVILVEQLHKSFGGVHALRGVDLSVPGGSTFGLVGPNGAGKTTLFSVISGFLQPTRGKVAVLGGSLSGAVLRGRLGVLPQDARWRKSVALGRQMIICARLQGMSHSEAQKDVMRVLALTGMEAYFNRAPDKLSHGMAKRVAIAQAFLGEPEVILLDEPLAGLDPAQARSIRLLIQKETGKRTFIISSHVMADIEALCSHVAIIKEGEIVAQPSMDELTRREGVAVFVLDKPPEEALKKSFEALDYVSKVELRKVERKLQITVRTDQMHIDEAIAAFIHILIEQKTTFVSINKGTSLEDAVLQVT
ncbi:MAG: ABC transporter ATP-binding protein [Deltaproteobacteria bacterium]|nr:ABC transporter ATP-binding protein [Deltaproteobacteria bacterium]